MRAGEFVAKASRDKGCREERAIVNHWRSLGVEPESCVRVPLSGSADGFECDVRLAGHLVECKVRGDGFKELYRWIAGADILTVRADRKERLYVVTESQMQKWAERMGWTKP